MRISPPRPCAYCGLVFKPVTGNHNNLCSNLCRFLVKTELDNETQCWNWISYLSQDGYSVFRASGVVWKGHRWAYQEIGGGELIPGLTIDHLCRNRRCVNPAHMEQVTQAENYRRGRGGTFRRGATHCTKGHAFTDENTGWQSGGTKRYCRQCKRTREAPAARRYRARLRGTTI